MGAGQVTNLPEGFQLEQPAAQENLPAGFKLETQVPLPEGFQVETASVGDTLASLPERAWKGLVSSAVTANAAQDWAKTAGFSEEQKATFEMYPESPAAKKYFEWKKVAEQSGRTAKIMQQELKEARPAGGGLFDELVGGVAESLGASVIPSVALGVINPALGLAAGLTTNSLLEAGGQWEEATAKGATDEQIARSMGFGGAVSTILELPVLSQMKRMLEAGKPTLKAIVKAAGSLIGKEAGQEGGTQLAMDTEANISGWGNYSLREMAGRTGMAAGQGAIMGVVMGGTARGLSRVKQANMEVLQERALTDTLTAQLAEASGADPAQLKDTVGAVIRDLKTRQIDPELAAVQRAQLSGASEAIPATEFGTQLAALLDARFPQRARTDTEATGEADVGIAGEDVPARREDYISRHLAGNEMSLGDRIIYAGTSPGTTGLMLKQIDNLPDGSVTVLGGNLQSTAALFPGLMPEAIGEAVGKLAEIAGLTAPILVTMEQLEGGQTGMHRTINLPDGRLAHIINPRELPSAKAKYGFGNRTTIAEFVGTLTHEFGHAIEREKFIQGIIRQGTRAGIPLEGLVPLRMAIDSAIDSFSVTPKMVNDLRAFAPIEADLLERWSTLQQQARDGTISGKEFAVAWLGPRKFSWSFENTKSTQDIFTWVHKMAAQAGINKSIDNMTPAEVIQAITGKPGQEDSILGFKEFMAEQFSRAAHDRNYLKGTKLGTWFQDVLQALRDFFSSVKDQGFIKPDVTFDRWLDAQTATAKWKKPKKWGQIQLTKQLKAQQKKIKAQFELDRAQLAAEGEQELETDTSPEAEETELPLDEEAAQDAATIEGVTTMLETAIDMGGIKLDSPEHKAILGLIKKNQLEEASDRIWKATMKGINWDRDGTSNAGVISPMEVAGLTPEELANPGVVAYAKKLWQEMKFESPFFKRWNGKNMLVDSITGEPVVLYHGTGQKFSFFDPTLRGQATMVDSARKGFFFTANPANAVFYAKGGGARVGIYYKNEADARKAQQLRSQIQHIQEMLDDAYKSGGTIVMRDGTRQKLDKRLWKGKQIRLERLLVQHVELSPKLNYEPTIGSYFIRMENPLILDFEGQEWQEGIFVSTLQKGLMLGHDGVVFKNARDPMLDDIYIAFSPEQIKSTENEGTFGEHDRINWDRGNPREDSLRLLGSGIEKLSGSRMWRENLNLWARVSDSLVQLQQRAVRPLPDGTLDLPMQDMLQALQKGEAFKNTLQQPAEVLVKELKKRSQKELDSIYGFLEAEWKSGELWYDLQGWTAGPEVGGRQLIWGNLEDGGRDVTSATGKEVDHWEFGPPVDPGKQKRITEALRKFGIEPGTERGEQLHQFILDIKNTQLAQFTALQNVLERKLATRWLLNPAVAVMELEKLYQSMQKIRLTPFFPQGNYGNFVVTVQELKAERKPGERKYKTIRVEYYESKAEMDVALRKWNTKKTSGQNVDWKKLDDYKGIPLTLPRNLLESLEQTNLFSKVQLDAMSTLMIPAGHEKLVVRYGKQNELMDGGERDILRNYSNFMWHNANFIWKLDFRAGFTKAINAHRAQLRKAQKDISPGGLEQASLLQRNHDLMNRVKDYVLYPPYEFQGIRTAAALVYLAYNVKTALMNFSTMLNSYAAITTEFGERKGHYYFSKGLWDAARLIKADKSPQTKHIIGEVSAEESPLVWMYNKAVSEGVLDQSYAYFLAGQANSPTVLRGVTGGMLGKLGYLATEYGMAPFRFVEKANRLATLTMMFEAERGRGIGIEAAYQSAVQKTNLLQNAYDAGNRSELFRGKKAILTMFASYLQFMTWNMMGGYSKALKADVAARGNMAKIESALGAGGYTAKLWMMYMILGGLLAPPFAENVLEFLQYIWRKVYKTNLRMEIRQFINELGLDPNLVMHGVLGNFGGMDLSGSFSLGRILPGVDLLNRDFKDYQQVIGALAVKGAGPFGGFTEDMLKFVEAAAKYMQGQARGSEVVGELPGAVGAIGRAVDATVLQSLRPTGAVLDKAGARVVEDPPGSGNFRDLTEWEIVSMALGANPAVLARSREMNYMEAGEQIYWRSRKQTLLDNRNEAILTQDEKRLEAADKGIVNFNESLPEKYRDFAITGKMKAQSLKSKRNTIKAREEGKGPKAMKSIMGDVKTAWGGSATP